MTVASAERRPEPDEAIDLEFRVLGPVAVVRDGEPIRLGGPRQQALLALLLIERGRAVSSDLLVHELWRGEPPEGAAITLRSYVSRLRAALGSDALVTATVGGYSLNVSPESIDAVRFERLVRDGDDALRRGSARRAADRLREALGMWGGEPFAGLAAEGVLRVEAERLQELRLHALQARVEADLALGRASELIDELEALVRTHPFHERLWRHLMLALYRAGRQADALDAYHRARAALEEQLGIEPGEELESLQLAILRHEVPALPAPQAEHNLPAPLTSFIGRSGELAELSRILGGARLVTLTGVGGVGKTRLAIEAAWRALSDSADSAFFVDLAAITDPSLVVHHLAQALGVREAGEGELIEQIAKRLGASPVLLVLDNCEHVRDACALIARALLPRCPGVVILATSRVALGAEGEVDYAVPPLPVPPLTTGADDLRTNESVALFLGRARDARPALRDDAAALASAARICRDLDGLPLAIELAAARAKAFSLDEIADRIADRFQFLVSWRRLTPGRHQTLRQAIDWSYQLLADEERELLARLSVFAGSFTLDAVADVHLAAEMSRAVDLFTRLVDASLVLVADGGPTTRYRLLETVRQYVAEKLDERATAEARASHAHYFLALAERAAAELGGERQAEWFATLEVEHENLRTALDYFAHAGEGDELPRLAVALTRFWYVRGHLSEARVWLERAIASGTAPATLRRRALTAAASIALLEGDYHRSIELANASLDVARETGDAMLVANGLSNLGAIVLASGDNARAGDLLREALELARAAGDERVLALALNNLADHSLTVGEYERAEPLFQESLALLRKRGDTANIARSLFNLGAVALKRGRHVEAEALFGDSLSMSRAAGDKEDVAWCFVGLAALAADRNEAARAAVLLGAAVALLGQMGAAFKPFERQLHAETEARVRALIGRDAFDETLAGVAALPEPALLALEVDAGRGPSV